ncbi:hypothetical protein AMECASPLE_028328 [Ameca splendens]|uniref:Uncharacterized protein n=1 Tax=Ameca splendens TaxID=208324 RepID=A0ABV0YT88_9TELE
MGVYVTFPPAMLLDFRHQPPGRRVLIADRLGPFPTAATGLLDFASTVSAGFLDLARISVTGLAIIGVPRGLLELHAELCLHGTTPGRRPELFSFAVLGYL